MKNSLFSTITTLYILVLLYFPSFSPQLIFSPVIFSTLILLLYILRLGADEISNPQNNESVSPELVSVHETEDVIDSWWPDPGPFHADSFVEWNVRAPLEVIYEEYEGEEEGNDAVFSGARRESEMNAIQRYASLSLFYPESDGDGSSEGDSSSDGDWDATEENMRFRWEDNLIEIALDEKKCGEVEEENLIEIDLSPTFDFPAIHV